MRRLLGDVSPELGLAGLHHDSHEAYVGDIPTPLKRVLGEPLRLMVEQIDAAIATALGLDMTAFEHEAIHKADAEALRMEAYQLKASQGDHPDWGFTGPHPSPPEDWVFGLSAHAAERAFVIAHEYDASRLPSAVTA